MIDIKFDLNDIQIIPAITSDIRSRSEVYSRYGNILPIIVSPMDSVIDEYNYNKFLDCGMVVCLPRGIDENMLKDNKSIYNDNIFYSFGLEEIEKKINVNESLPSNILLDIANGHMNIIITLIKRIKSEYTGTKVMVGNIANPETYRVLSEAGADYIRVGIGGGSGCITSSNTGVHYPMGSLIKECKDIKNKTFEENQIHYAFIVADGGFKNYSDIIKGLALGADFVMLGGILNKCIESCAPTYYKGIKLNNKLANFLFKKKFKLTKSFRGMATKEVQKKWGRKTLKTAEGLKRINNVEYTLKGWTENFEDYLKSTMSYTNSYKLSNFIGHVKYVFISVNAFNRFNR